MSIPPDDRGFALGHGLFETILFENGAPRAWDAHMARLARGCGVIGLPAPGAQACQAAAQAALGAAGRPERAAVRINWSAGSGGRGLDAPENLAPRLTAHAAPAPRPAGPASLAIVRVRRNEGSPTSRLKTLSYLDNVLARAEARAAGADEALMLNTRGEVACAAAANVFWVRGGVVETPALDCGVLDGVVRAEVLETCAQLGVPVREVRATPAEIRDLPIFLTNSLIKLRIVSRFEGVELPAPHLLHAISAALMP